MKEIPLILLMIISQLFSQDSTQVKIPKKAVKYSIIPGGGQLYNGKPIKAGLILGSELWMLYQFHGNRLSFNNWDKNDSRPKEFYRENRNKYAWYSFFVYLYNLVDALVDSHLSTYNDDDFENSKEIDLEKEDKVNG